MAFQHEWPAPVLPSKSLVPQLLLPLGLCSCGSRHFNLASQTGSSGELVRFWDIRKGPKSQTFKQQVAEAK